MKRSAAQLVREAIFLSPIFLSSKADCPLRRSSIIPMFLSSIFLSLTIEATADVGRITWLHWGDAEEPVTIQTQDDDVEVTLKRASDKGVLADAEALSDAGWNLTGDGFIRTPERAGGEKIVAYVNGLTPGTHDVYLQFFSQPREEGNLWWYISKAGVDTPFSKEIERSLNFDSRDNRIVRGTGPGDPDTVYEIKLGTVGSGALPTRTLSVWVKRYEWSQFSKIGSIRIETKPDPNYAYTQDAGEFNDQWRSAFLPNGSTGSDAKAAYGVKVCSAALKVRPKSFKSLEGQHLTDAIEITSARNESENRQILAYSPDKDLENVRLSASDLRSDSGEIISADNIRFVPVGYVFYSVPYDLDVHGYWPDPILEFKKSFKIRRHDVQSLWYGLRVPADAKPGVYTGKAIIEADNASVVEVPVELKVWDFELPKMPHFRFVIGGANSEFQMKYGICPSNIYGFYPEWKSQLASWAAGGVRAWNVAFVHFRHHDSHKMFDEETKMPRQEDLEKWLDRTAELLDLSETHGIRDKAYLYIFDEAPAEWQPAMQKVASEAKKRFPHLPIMTTSHDETFGESGKMDEIDWWCPLPSNYVTLLDDIAKARARGKQVWWYTCNSPIKPFANFLMTHSAMDGRMLVGFISVAYEVDGFLYYALNMSPNSPITDGPYTTWKVRDNAHDHLRCAGPDRETALPTIRLENIRDGLEDNEYLYMARKLAAAIRDAGIEDPSLDRLASRIRPFFNVGNPLVESVTSFSEDTEQLENTRRLIGDYIESAQRLLGHTGVDE